MKAARTLMISLILVTLLAAAAYTGSAEPALTAPIRDITIYEDSPSDRSLNLNDHFTSETGEITYSSITSDNRVNVIIHEDGNVDIAPAENWFGAEDVTIIASDGEKEVGGTMRVKVEPTNDPPQFLAPDTSFTVSFNEDQVLKEAFNLNNYFLDIDSALIFKCESENVIVSIHDDGAVYMSASENWFGTEQVAFKVSDGEFEIYWHLLVNVNPVNDAPLSHSNPKPVNLAADTRTQTLDLKDHFSDLEDDSLSYDVSGNFRIKSKIRGDSGLLILEAPDDWSGKEVITITARDSEGEAKSVQVLVISSSGPNNPRPTLYLAGLVLAFSIVGVGIHSSLGRFSRKSPVKLESYRYYRGP